MSDPVLLVAEALFTYSFGPHFPWARTTQTERANYVKKAEAVVSRLLAEGLLAGRQVGWMDADGDMHTERLFDSDTPLYATWSSDAEG